MLKLNGEVNQRTKAGWSKCKRVSSVFCDRNISVGIYGSMKTPCVCVCARMCVYVYTCEEKYVTGKTRSECIRGMHYKEEPVKIPVEEIRSKRSCWK